ncbi:hypothetical protein LOC67_23305 [Stieleria sp. JC731]|uniref:hypothetical protein n=1 Tax=Pirellulaceae TaxID=2691357 RepID=UPI001E46EF5E|nr:hypothetical protein [Stieleria sp. JC731]MCC9603487.1 hypothetical protein [Stieleria sp. JC731]
MSMVIAIDKLTEKQLLKDKIHRLEHKAEYLQLKLNGVKDHNEALMRKTSELECYNKTLEASNKVLREDCAALNEKSERQSRRLANMASQMAQLDKDKESLQNEMKRLQGDREYLRKKHDTVVECLVHAREECEQLKNRCKSLESELGTTKLMADTDRFNNAHMESEVTIRQMQGVVDSQKLADNERQISMMTSEIRYLNAHANAQAKVISNLQERVRTARDPEDVERIASLQMVNKGLRSEVVRLRKASHEAFVAINKERAKHEADKRSIIREARNWKAKSEKLEKQLEDADLAIEDLTVDIQNERAKFNRMDERLAHSELENRSLQAVIKDEREKFNRMAKQLAPQQQPVQAQSGQSPIDAGIRMFESHHRNYLQDVESRLSEVNVGSWCHTMTIDAALRMFESQHRNYLQDVESRLSEVNVGSWCHTMTLERDVSMYWFAVYMHSKGYGVTRCEGRDGRRLKISLLNLR